MVKVVTREQFLTDLKELVNIDSFSRHPEGTTKIADILQGRFEGLGWHVERRDIGSEVGPLLIVRNKPEADSIDILMLGHMDTVFPVGTVAERPFTMDDEFAYGPGVADMKDGLVAGWHVCRTLTEQNELGDLSVGLVFNPDEEISSIFSRPHLEEVGKLAKYCIILESARLNGNFVKSRKGIGKYVVEFFGKAVHAGVEPEKGANAINEFIATGAEINTWARPELGTTINIGTIQGGTTPNTVPDYVRIEIDVRLENLEEGTRVDELMQSIPERMHVAGVTAKVTGGIKRPPMVKTEKTEAFIKVIDTLKEELGIVGEWVHAGGASDGNFIAPLGVPTVDGMGPAGGNVHSENEKLVLKDIEERVQLVYNTILWIRDNK